MTPLVAYFPQSRTQIYLQAAGQLPTTSVVNLIFVLSSYSTVLFPFSPQRFGIHSLPLVPRPDTFRNPARLHGPVPPSPLIVPF